MRHTRPSKSMHFLGLWLVIFVLSCGQSSLTSEDLIGDSLNPFINAGDPGFGFPIDGVPSLEPSTDADAETIGIPGGPIAIDLCYPNGWRNHKDEYQYILSLRTRRGNIGSCVTPPLPPSDFIGLSDQVAVDFIADEELKDPHQCYIQELIDNLPSSNFVDSNHLPEPDVVTLRVIDLDIFHAYYENRLRTLGNRALQLEINDDTDFNLNNPITSPPPLEVIDGTMLVEVNVNDGKLALGDIFQKLKVGKSYAFQACDIFPDRLSVAPYHSNLISVRIK